MRLTSGRPLTVSAPDGGQSQAGGALGSGTVGTSSQKAGAAAAQRAGETILLPGDAEGEAVGKVVSGPITAVEVPHHGSAGGLDAALLSRFDPSVAVISVDGDTVAAADGLRRLFGRLRVHEHSKIDRIRALVDEHVDVDGLLGALQ